MNKIEYAADKWCDETENVDETKMMFAQWVNENPVYYMTLSVDWVNFDCVAY